MWGCVGEKEGSPCSGYSQTLIILTVLFLVPSTSNIPTAESTGHRLVHKSLCNEK